MAGAIRAVLGYAALYMVEKVGQTTAYRLRNNLFTKFQGLSFGYHDQQKTGDLMPRATVDIESAGRFISLGLLHGVSSVSFYVLPIVIMLLMDWRLGLIVLVARRRDSLPALPEVQAGLRGNRSHECNLAGESDGDESSKVVRRRQA